MQEYLSINKKKVLYRFLGTATLVVLIWTIYLLSEYKDGVTLSLAYILLGYFIYLFFLPALAQILTTTFDLIEFNRNNRILESNPIAGLRVLGFEKTYSHKNSNWLLSKPVLTGTIDKYPVKCIVEGNTTRIIADTNLGLIEKEHWKMLKSMFGKNRIENGLPGVALVYDSSRRRKLTFSELEKELLQLTEYLKQQQLLPYKNKSYA